MVCRLKMFKACATEKKGGKPTNVSRAGPRLKFRWGGFSNREAVRWGGVRFRWGGAREARRKIFPAPSNKSPPHGAGIF